MSTAGLSLVLRMPVRSAGPACRSGACCRFRRSCCSRACATWSAFRDARMSGTSYGACVLHVAPEAYIGGPLALVETGDMIEIDVAARSIISSMCRRGR